MAALLLYVPLANSQGTPSNAKTKWPTTKFEVLNVCTSKLGAFGLMFSVPDATTKQEPFPERTELRKLEEFLTFSAIRMQDWGFPAPDIEVFTSKDKGEFYRLYMIDIEPGTAVSCDGGPKKSPADDGRVTKGLTKAFPGPSELGEYSAVTIDRTLVTSPGNKTLLPTAYITAAHELFHAVQHRTTYGYLKAGSAEEMVPEILTGKKVWAWILEGTADAIGHALYMEYFEARPVTEVADWDDFYGARPYNIPLALREKKIVRDSNLAYTSLSFWRYLAELNHKKIVGPTASMPGPTIGPADFSYLAKLLNLPHRGDDLEAQYAWLDEGLKNQTVIKQNLVDIIPRFFTTFAGYERDLQQSRFIDKDHLFIAKEKLTQKNWLPYIFGPCIQMKLHPTKQDSREALFTIAEVAARCIEIEVVEADADIVVDVQVQVDAKKNVFSGFADAMLARKKNGKDLVGQLWLGTPGGQTLGPVKVQAPISADVQQGIWTNQIVVRSNSPSFFVLSNVGKDVAGTEPLSGTLKVTMNRQSKAASLGPVPKGLQHEGPLGFDDRHQTAAERALASGTALSGTAPLAMSFTASDSEMNLKLGVSPDILNALSGSAGSGGILDQILVSGAAMEANQALFTQAIQQAMQYNRTVPGAEVSIELPPLDYGFTGTLNNVLIRSSGGPGPDRFTVGPKDAVPGRDIRFDPSGTVTITEYSPWTLTGSYQGQLVDPNPTPAQRQQSQPVLEVIETVQGTFSVSAPWLGDERIAKDMPVDPWADMETDIANRLPPGMTDIATAVVNEAKKATQDGREPNFSSVRSAGGQSATTCDCSCAGLAALERMGAEVDATGRAPTESERALAFCAMTCAPQYARCEAD